jgi:hypothetical protein
MCWRCDMTDAIARRAYSPAQRAQIERAHAVIEMRMAEDGIAFGEAMDALERERLAEFAELRADYAERHGLDDDETMFALYRHCIDGPGRVQ